MGNPETWRPLPGSIPTAPGVYRFWDDKDRVVYVGKARSLRSRLSSYFQSREALHPRTASMVAAAVRVDWVVVGSEAEALSLEYTWIKEYAPRFNVKYRDDKSYPYLAVTMNEDFPRVMVLRGAKRKGVRYFGPYPQAWAIRETVDLLLRVFPMRSCRDGVFKDAARTGRPCLLGYIDRCSAPCVGKVSPAEHRIIAEQFVEFMAGAQDTFIADVRAQMQSASDNEDYERAARLRDDIGALQQATERNALVFPEGGRFDVVGVTIGDLQAAVSLFHIRQGRIRGQRGFIVDLVDEVDAGSLIEQLLMQVYTAAEDIPPEVLVPTLPDDAAAIEHVLAQIAGHKIRLRVPSRGNKREFMETANANAADTLNVQTLRRGHDLTARSAALRQLQEACGLAQAPYRIECVDISNTSGTNVVGALVVFEDALPAKRDYRSYAIKGAGGTDDLAAMHEVLTRRFAHASNLDTPDLLMVDGGAPQVAAAAAALKAVGVDVPLIGLAKRLEEVWLVGQSSPLILPRTSDALFLLQRIRDEAHRSAIALHRKRRSRAMLVSALDSVPGLGPARRRTLMERFGDVRGVQAATVDEISALPGFGPALAVSIVSAVQGESDTAMVVAAPPASTPRTNRGSTNAGQTATNSGQAVDEQPPASAD